MKKLLLSLALFAAAIGVNAQTQVTNETVSTSIVDGAVISLQCQDTNGGVDYYFNGDQVKSASFQPSNLFAVVGTENGFYLQQKTSGKYVGGATTANALVQLVDDQSSANVFTAAVASPTGWTTKPATVEPGVNTIRFTTGSTFLNTNSTTLVPKYFNGTGGFSAWYVYSYTEEEVNEIIGSQVDVTFTFPAFGGQTLTMTIEGKINVDASTIIPAVPFFTATGVDGDNVTVTAENTEFTVTGEWAFPFADEEVYRIDIRLKSAQHGCSNLLYEASTKKVNTRNTTNQDAFVPERLFYLAGKGFDATTGSLIVTLHSIAADASTGFQVAVGNNSVGVFSETPTEFRVVTNSNGTGISLQHPESNNAHVNDLSSGLGIWNHASSQNDAGSFLRFGALTDDDFDGLMSGDLSAFITQDMLDAAKASKKATEVRALFNAAAPYLAAVAEAEALIASIGIYTADHFGEDLGYFYGTDYDAIAALTAALQGTLEGTDAAAITAATAALAEEVAKVQVHLPEAGKYYRFKGVEGGWYITPNAATGQMVMTEEPSANSAFRFDEVAGENNVFVPFNVVYQTGITGTHSLGGSETYTFYPSQSGEVGAFTIKSNATGGAGTWLYNHYDRTEGSAANRNSVFHERCNWYLEEVDENGTGIEEIAVESDKVQGIYDLQGRRLSAPVKGINIINGKKVLVK